jgi:hypothetical protein
VNAGELVFALSGAGERRRELRCRFCSRRRGKIPTVPVAFGLYVFIVVVGLLCGIAASLA